MPAFGEILTTDQIWKLVTYVESLPQAQAASAQQTQEGGTR